MLYRLGVLVTILGLLAAGVFFAPQPELNFSLGKSSQLYQVEAVDQSVVCPGSLIRSGGDSGTKLGVFDRTGSALLSGSTQGSGGVAFESLDAKSVENLESTISRSLFEKSISKPVELIATNREGEQGSVALNATQYQVAALSSMRGFAAANCQQPSNELMLIGGSTATGREALLILANPSAIDAVADLRLFTDLGEITVAGLSGISIMANSSVIIPLASFAPSVAQLAVSVSSEGAKLAGWIQQRVVRGTSAYGVDLISPTDVFSKEQVIPGFLIRGSEEIAKAKKQEDFEDASHALRIYAPEAAKLTIQVLSDDLAVYGAVFTAEVEAGTVLDLPIEELEDGNYSVFITSDVNVYSGLRVARGNPAGTPRLDFAWLTPSEEIIGERVISTSDNLVSFLTLANNSQESVAIKVRESGAETTVSLLPGATKTVEVSGTVLLSTSGQIFAKLTVLLEGQISDLDITNPQNLGREVQVYFR
ncbi:MAG: DUF5719 family protein [Actinomycetota bacterium]